MSELLVYQKAYTLLLDVFKRTDAFPKSKSLSPGRRLEARRLDFVTLANGFRYVRDKDARVRQMTTCFDVIKLLHEERAHPRPARRSGCPCARRRV